MSTAIDRGLESSFWGAARGAAVELLVFPLEGIKIRQQCAPIGEKSVQIARRVLTQEGLLAFYKGFPPQLGKTCMKQIWCWPMITGIPPYLHAYGIGETHQQLLTGLSIATVDATITTPLERAKILSALTKKSPLSQRACGKGGIASFYKEGWQGFATYWTKRSVNMTTFLIAQKVLRDQNRTEVGAPLSPFQLVKIGTEVALIVSLVAAPFDIANTIKQAENLSPSLLFSRRGISPFYRGWPLNALSLVIHNIASVIIMEKMSATKGVRQVH